MSNFLCHADCPLSNHLQLLVVTSEDWEQKQGRLQRFERLNRDEVWISIGTSMPVVLGKSGMAWGIGLYQLHDDTASCKVEGDLKSPAGFFSLGCAFGFLPQSQMAHLKMDYLQLNEFTEAIDDPFSIYYNDIVDSRELVPDWESSEKMREESLYENGLVIHNNWPQPQSGKGSAIFFHKWRHFDAGTAGCTAMDEEDLAQILVWLEKNKNPLLIQLPVSVYSQFQFAWNLPELQFCH